ncbi:MAG: hypothetical protein Q9195_005267 [Heterodermia aff. obscurata]
MSKQSRDDDLFEAKKVVRTFSWKTHAENPDDELAKSLVAAEALDRQDEKNEAMLGEQWRQLFDPATSKAFGGSNEEILLAPSTDELAKAYKAFLKCLPKAHEARIEDGPPRIRTVVEAVATADSTWKRNRESTKAGRMKTLFSKVCGSLNGHKDLFAILPSGDKYVCLVTGSVSAIVKATVNHDKIAEGVSNALDDLSDDVQYWQKTLEVYEDDTLMKEYVAKLYVVVFKFLVGIMTKWSKSSVARFLRSFDSSFFDEEIQQKKMKIRDLEHRLERQGSLAMKSSVKKAPSKEDIAKIVSASQANFQMELFIKAEQLKRELGSTVKNTLQQEFLNNLWAQRDQLLLGANSPLARSRAASPMPDPPNEADNFYRKKQLELIAHRLLQQNTQQKHVHTMVAQSEDLSIHVGIFDRIQQWNAAKTSQCLWIQGPFQASRPSHYTLLNTYILATAERASIPAISYFCEPGTDIVQMVYSLILQTVALIPDDFRSDLDFTSARFDTLAGTTDSLSDAIHLFKDLLSVGPYLLFILVDGLQVLGTASNAGPLTNFVRAIRDFGEEATDRSRTVKTLFTTDGFVQALTALKGNQRLDALDFIGEDLDFADGIEVGFL